MAKKPCGIVLWTGKSKIDGTPIVVLATMHSVNVKTGNMVQVYVMRDDVKPNDAVRKGLDVSVCGHCPHRGGNGKKRTCYVRTWQGPRSAWQAYKRGRYAEFDGDYSVFQGRSIRWGAYGDPSLIPFDIVSKVNDIADSYTGYTHQWQEEHAQQYKTYFQASCDSVTQFYDATEKGWASFTVLPIDMNKEVMGRRVTTCPASLTDKVKCIDCGLCNGTADAKPRNIVIHAHGKSAKDVIWAAA